MSIERNPVLAEYPNSAFNVFLMMRFADSVANRKVVRSLRTALRRYGMNLLRADQKAYSESLWENVKYYMNACDLGVAAFEQLVKKDYNPNVSLELGHMLALGKKVLLLKEHHLPRLPSDIVGHLYKEFDARDIATTIRHAVDAWLQDDRMAVRNTTSFMLSAVLRMITVEERCSPSYRVTKIIDREQRTENREQRTENREQRTDEHLFAAIASDRRSARSSESPWGTAARGCLNLGFSTRLHQFRR